MICKIYLTKPFFKKTNESLPHLYSLKKFFSLHCHLIFHYIDILPISRSSLHSLSLRFLPSLPPVLTKLSQKPLGHFSIFFLSQQGNMDPLTVTHSDLYGITVQSKYLALRMLTVSQKR